MVSLCALITVPLPRLITFWKMKPRVSFLLSFLCWVIELHSFGGDEANGYGGQAGMVHFWGGWELS